MSEINPRRHCKEARQLELRNTATIQLSCKRGTLGSRRARPIVAVLTEYHPIGVFGVLDDHCSHPAAVTHESRYESTYATRAKEFHGRPSEISDIVPAPVEGTIAHWSKTNPAALVFVDRLWAVRLMPSLLGAMVDLRKYPAPDPQIISMFPSM